MMNKAQALSLLEGKSDKIVELCRQVWETPELIFEEYRSVQAYYGILEEEGFRLSRGIAGMPTAFLAEYGEGGPVIAFLSEYDALPNLGQKAGVAYQESYGESGNGHGCGHNLMGTGSLAAAILVKDYLRENGLAGTVRLYGTPGEEGGLSKCYMVRDGLFDDVDACLCWHPENVNFVMPCNHLAVIMVQFRFKGVSAHAAMAPHNGRSALDAVELMNVGVNFLREHVISDARIHYAIVDAGGPAANVVQEHAQVNYTIRAPKLDQCRDILARVEKVAKGAAIMTDTEVTCTVDSGIADTLVNVTMDQVVYENYKALGTPPVDDEDRAFAQAIRDRLPPHQLDYEIERAQTYFGANYAEEVAAHIRGKPVVEYLYPYVTSDRIFYGSTDVGDVTQVTPTAQLGAACFAQGTPYHTWMMTSQANAPLAFKAMLHAGKVMGCAGIDLLERPEVLRQAREELNRRTGGKKYQSFLPRDKKPV